MNFVVCSLATLILLTVPGDFAANRLVLLLFMFALGILHHQIKGRPVYYRATEYVLLGSVFIVWLAAFFSPHYFLLQPLINLALTIHTVSVVIYYWPVDSVKRKESFTVLYKALPWLLVALLVQVKAQDWIPTVKQSEKNLPTMTMPDTVSVGDTTAKAINIFDSLSKAK